MIVAAAVGGVNWLIGVGGAGTALGTLGLAYFTFTVAARTTELADSSQRLEAAAREELTAGRQQARAAAAAVLEAEKSRIDALAPIIDFTVHFTTAEALPRGVTPTTPITLSTTPGQHGNVEQYSLTAKLRLTLRNFGRTPGFVRVTYSGAAFDHQTEELRIDPPRAGTSHTLAPTNERTFEAVVDYPGTMIDPFAPREVRYDLEVHGAMSGDITDTIIWLGELTLLQRDTTGWHRHPNPLTVKSYTVIRDHRLDA
jgi:hypothetical protein